MTTNQPNQPDMNTLLRQAAGRLPAEPEEESPGDRPVHGSGDGGARPNQPEVIDPIAAANQWIRDRARRFARDRAGRFARRDEGGAQ